MVNILIKRYIIHTHSHFSKVKIPVLTLKNQGGIIPIHHAGTMNEIKHCTLLQGDALE